MKFPDDLFEEIQSDEVLKTHISSLSGDDRVVVSFKNFDLAVYRTGVDGGKRLKYISGIVNQTEDSHVECGCFLGKFVPAKKVRQVPVSGFKKIEKPEIPVSYRFQEELIQKVDGLIVQRLTLNSIALIKELGDA